VKPYNDHRCHPFGYAIASGHQARPKEADHLRNFSLYRDIIPEGRAFGNAQIEAKVQVRRPDLKAQKSIIRDARLNLEFKVRPPMVKPDLSPEQRFRRHQLGLDMLAKNLDPATIVFSDEYRFVLGSDK
jgi:hypothetical protein